MIRGRIMRRLNLSCVRSVYFLRKSTEFHDMRTECQIILPNVRKQFSPQFRVSKKGEVAYVANILFNREYLNS